MNYRMVINILGKTMLVGAILLCFPLIVGLIYCNNNHFSFLIPMCVLTVIGIPLSLIKIEDKSIYAREGFVIVAFAWIIMSLTGCLPFIVSGEIPSFADAFFETVSGFTTTGATILSDVEKLSESMMFWRLFTHWIGGMGVLVFVLAILPGYNEGSMHVFRAESPGPSVGKLVSKISFTARILYGIYFVMTCIEIIMLLCGGMSFYDSVLHAFSTAGTGGFAIKNDGVASYNVYCQIVMGVFMFLFGINFNLFYLITIGQFGKAIKSEELKVYALIVLSSVIVIALNVFFGAVNLYDNFASALKDAFFQTTSIISTTGLSSTDYGQWPTLSKSILMFLTVIGACAGSTGGGLKISRLVILVKSAGSDIKKLIRPRSVVTYKFEKEPVDGAVSETIKSFFVIWCFIVIASTVILSIDPFGDFLTNFSATLATIGNVGPGLNAVGPACNYGGYSAFSKIWMSFVMLAGRLEIFPVLIMFFPHTWKKH